jgi:molybdopterin-guanine dinucleotide biosynthesis protein A
MTAIILAGGKSSRMGQDKALLKFGGKTLVENLIEIVAPLFDETLLIVNEGKKFMGLGLKEARIYEDWVKDEGPLSGIYTGLSWSRNEASCVLTCDMPFIDRYLIYQLMRFWKREFDVVCFTDPDGKVQPFPGIYQKRRRSLIRLLFRRQEASMKRYLERVRVEEIPLHPSDMKSLLNMNTPEDYAQVLKMKAIGVS